MTDNPHDNEAVRSALAKAGDKGLTPREVNFYFYGGDFEGLAAVAEHAGYHFRWTAKRDGVIVQGILAVDEASFAAPESQMEKWAEQFGCEYDGWEARVVKQ